MAKPKIILSSGRRKTAMARASLRAGTGVIKVNNVPVENFGQGLYNLRVKEPIIIAGETIKKIDINVTVSGGGAMSQADAVRLAIARVLSEYDKKLKEVFADYDRQLLVADIRTRESRKPNCQGKARSRRQKSYR